jgi:hypothetical protein
MKILVTVVIEMPCTVISIMELEAESRYDNVYFVLSYAETPQINQEQSILLLGNNLIRARDCSYDEPRNCLV